MAVNGIILLGTVFLSFVFWAWLHEMAHVGMAHLLIGLERYEVEIYLWPREQDDGSWRWAWCRWYPKREPTEREKGWASLAPRFIDIIGASLVPCFWLAPEGWRWVWVVFMGGALVDAVVGSIGKSAKSDLKRASRRLGVNPWFLRIAGFGLVLVSVLVTLLQVVFST